MTYRASALLGLAAGVLFFLFSDPFLSPPDCALYWSWAQSLFTDFDFAFTDEYSAFEVPIRYVYLTSAGRLSNDWPLGAGLALGPWVLAGRTLAHAWVILLCVAAVALWARSCVPGSAAWGASATIAGTPLLFYLGFGPFFSHAASFAATTAFLVLWAKTREGRSTPEWILLGLLLGAAAFVRPQNLLLGVVFLAEFPRWRRSPPPVRDVGLATLAALLAFAPQLAAWQLLYGRPLALPKVDEMNWLAPAIGSTLLSDYHGLLPWTPVYALALAGLAILGRSDRSLAAGLGLVFLVQLYVNAANEVWWSGGSFGNRRLMDSAIVVAWGVAALAGTEKRSLRVVARIAIVACCVWTTWLLLAERAGALPLSRYVPFASDEFRAALSAPLSDPARLWNGLARWEMTTSSVALRIAGALLIAGGIMLAPAAMRSLARKDAAKWAAATGAAAAAALLLCVVAGVRTPAFDGDPELVERLGTEPGVLWDNYTEQAYYLQRRGRFVEMEEAARKAVDAEPDLPTGWWYLSVALLQQDRRTSALDALAELLRRDPMHANGRRLWEELTGATPPSP